MDVRGELRWPAVVLIVVFGVQLLAACSRIPLEIKNASTAQLELIKELDNATRTLQQGLNQFHRENEDIIIAQGRILLARQAIQAALRANAAPVTADQLFDISNKDIRPWVEKGVLLASLDDDIARLDEDTRKLQDQITKLDGQIQSEIEPTTKRKLEARREMLRISKAALDIQRQNTDLRKAELQNMPQAVADQAAGIKKALERERGAAKTVHEQLELLRAQTALMKAMAARVDEWLSIDLTVSQEQADALKKAFAEANEALGGKK